LERRPLIVLDTHAWIWWAAESPELSGVARAALCDARRIGVCAISVWEVAMLVQKKRLVLDRDAALWTEQALALARIELLPLSPEIAVRAAAEVDSTITDPADRMIVATAIVHRGILVTKDERLRISGSVPTVW